MLPVYLAALGQNALSETCGCFGKAGQATFIWNLLNLAALKGAMSVSLCLVQQYQDSRSLNFAGDVSAVLSNSSNHIE